MSEGTAVATVDQAAEARRLAVRQSLVAGNTPRAIVPTDFDGAWRISQAVVAANMAPRSLETVEKCAIAILHGLEVGLAPMQALQSISVINGRPSLWGDGALGLIQASTFLEDQDEHYEGKEGEDGYKAVCILKRRGKNRAYRAEFSIGDAKTAGLWTKRGRNGEATPWQTYPKRMLKMRARAFAMRDGFSDVLKGLSIAEEQQDVERANMVEAEQQPRRRVPSPPPETTEEKPAEQQAEATTATMEVASEAIAEPAEADATHTDVTAGMESTGTVVNDFPGDKPIEKEPEKPAINPEELEIPYVLDVRVRGPEKDWLRGINEAFAECHDIDSLMAEQESVMTPAKESVSDRAWAHAVKITKEHLARIQGS